MLPRKSDNQNSLHRQLRFRDFGLQLASMTRHDLDTTIVYDSELKRVRVVAATGKCLLRLIIIEHYSCTLQPSVNWRHCIIVYRYVQRLQAAVVL